MDDKGHREVLPDRPPTNALARRNYRNKKKKGKRTPSTPNRHTFVSQPNMPIMEKQHSPPPIEQGCEHHCDMLSSKPSDLTHNNDPISEQVDSSPLLQDGARCDETMKKNQSNTLSYRESLLRSGYTRVSNGDADEDAMEEDDLLSDVLNKSWQLPQPSEEVQKLMNLYPVVRIEQDEYNEWCRPWNTALIITILGLRFNVYQLKEHLRRIWGIPEFEIIGLGNNYFSIRFTDTENWTVHYKKVLFEGPWVVSQHNVLVQRWTPYFDPHKNPLSCVVTWVRVSHIPLYCYNKHAISKLGRMIGKTLKIDLNNLSGYSAPRTKVERGRFARICVELDLQKKVVPGVIVANEICNVEYEGLGLICFACGGYGHRRENCP